MSRDKGIERVLDELSTHGLVAPLSMRLKAFITRGKVVVLYDFDGAVTHAIGYPMDGGEMLAERLPSHNVLLHPDGTVSGKSYVSQWRFWKANYV